MSYTSKQLRFMQGELGPANRERAPQIIKAGIPSKYWKMTLAQINEVFPSLSGAVKNLEIYLRNLDKNVDEGRNVLIYSVDSLGSGKTSLACSTLIEMLASSSGVSRYSGAYCKFVDMLKITNDFRAPPDFFQDPTCFLLDEVTMDDKYLRLHPSETLREVLTYRVENEKPTILTTSYSPKDFSKIFSARTFSLLESNTLLIDASGPDLRKVAGILSSVDSSFVGEEDVDEGDKEDA